MSRESAPRRIRLSRARGFRLPPGAINVARPSRWANPFVVGQDGTRAECVSLYAMLLGIGPCITCKAAVADQQRAAAYVRANLSRIKGRDLACWCALDGKPCHADVLLALANEPRRAGMLDRFLVGKPEAIAG